ncbi:MAG: gas vesicle protein K, partial [Candidatus Bathyarchaeia archaeon]
MPIDIEPEKLRDGLMGLVIALVDIIKDVLKRQAFKRIEGGTLTEEECERLGRAFMDLDEAISELKKEHGVRQAV